MTETDWPGDRASTNASSDRSTVLGTYIHGIFAIAFYARSLSLSIISM